MDGVPGDQIICLNVGGVRFSTTIRTMCRFPDTLIGRFFFEQLQGRRGTLPTKDGHSFIDRDGTHFRHILNFLRTPTGYKVEVGGNDLRELRCECVYYGIDKLMFPGTERRLRFCNMRNDTGAIAYRRRSYRYKGNAPIASRDDTAWLGEGLDRG
ncbi:BTB/POZ protein [Ochromonadaceae sp. CCMP2298]|nr:BTB/POZ protein [Ochromonadaceae sp. CCMP2298]